MAGNVIERELTSANIGTGRTRFASATKGDDAEIRRLLRDNPMPGRISISLERESDYFADADLAGETKQTIIARQDGRLVCVGSCSIRQRFVNGIASRVGYLGGLRLDAGYAGRFNILRRGYDFFRNLQMEAPADYYFTSIAADNVRARMLLERGLPGMPVYEFIGNYVTALLSVRGRHPVRNEGQNDGTRAEDALALFNKNNSQYQFAPCWEPGEITGFQDFGLGFGDFNFIKEGGRVVAGAALWDQRRFKQAVIRGYAPWLGRVRPVLNIVSGFTGGIRLPAVGEALANAFVAHFVCEPGRPDRLVELIAALRGMAAQRGIESLTLGFAANDPRLGRLREHFRCREYHSRLYLVRWPEFGGGAKELDGRVLAPEVALL